MKIVYGYGCFEWPGGPDVETWVHQNLAVLKGAGFDVEGFCLTLNPPGPHLRFPDLDRLWRRGDETLLAMYERLEERLQGADVLLNAQGLNLHPDFVARLPLFTVFQCFDDPEGSADLSRSVAAAYDLCLVGNVAEVDTYRSWGVRDAEWIPLGFTQGLYDPALREEDILEGQRDIDLIMLVDRFIQPRRARLDRLADAFPDAHFYGRGWPRGFLPWGDETVRHLRRAKIGPNLHLSRGPVNVRLYQLPANGIMQICDNKTHLGKVYELGKEVVGFDTVEECIDLCRYYLAHDRERREIAVNGWRRAMRDYNQVTVFARAVRLMETYLERRQSRPAENAIAVRHRDRTRWPRRWHRLIRPLVAAFRAAIRAAKALLRVGWHALQGRGRE